MKLKLKESIRANGVQYLPPAVVDTDEIGITQADADVLIRRGTASVYEEPAPVETDEQRAAREAAEAEAAKAAAEAEAAAQAAGQPQVIHVDDSPAEDEAAPAPAKAARKR
jgi:F0F1-type ATP synthase epsilon subunit